MALSEEEEAELIELLEYETDQETLAEYICRVTPRYPPPPHVMPLINLIERTRYEPVRAVISMPPRFAKTETCISGLAWRLELDPACYNAFCSATANFARDKSRAIQRRYLDGGGKLRKRTKSVIQWETPEGGGLFAAGTGTHIQGKPVSGIALIDDPVEGREAADSRLKRDKLWEWFNGDLLSRVEPGASVIVVCGRWHEDDLIGRLTSPKYDHEDYEELNLPAVIDQDGQPADERVLDEDGRTIRGKFRNDVQSLWPEQRPLEYLEGKRLGVGEYNWWSQYQGVPRPRGAALFRPDPARFSLESFRRNELGSKAYRMVIGVDPAATASSRADHSVAAVGAARGYGNDMEVFWLHVLRGQWTIPVFCRNLYELQQEWKIPLAIEAVGAFRAVPDILREVDPRLQLLPVELRGDKHTRAQPHSTAWNDHRSYTPIDAPWADDWIAEHTSFTGLGDAEDDQVDAGSHAFAALYRASAPRGELYIPSSPFG